MENKMEISKMGYIGAIVETPVPYIVPYRGLREGIYDVGAL